MKTVYGWIASSITLIYKLPQIYKLYKTKKSNDISIISLLIQTTGYIFYILHGIHIKDTPILLMGIGALFQTLILVLLFFLYKNKEKTKEIKKEIKKDSKEDIEISKI
jgi:MtN3 and saliva related transmembrane protein